jgi:hypothetical protein
LILESCNQEKENNVLPTTKTLGKNDSIIYDTEGNIQSVIKLFGKLKRKVTFYGKGEVDFLISEDDKKNEILFFNNSQLYKIEKKKIYDESHDQFLYFDTTNHSVSIDGNRSHGVITYFELDTVRQGESQRLKILSIGNRKMAGKHINDVVKYDVAFNEDAVDKIELVNTKQINDFGVELSIKPLKKGKIELHGYLLQYYKMESSEIHQTNPFTVVFYSE